MKKVLFIVATLVATVSFGQKKPSTVSVNVGATALYPITKTVATKMPSYGETLQLSCKPGKVTYTVAGTYLQNKDNFVQIPVLAGLSYPVYKNVSANLSAGVSFFNGTKTQFTYSPSLSATFKKFTVSQTLLSTVVDGKTASSIGFGLAYKF